MKQKTSSFTKVAAMDAEQVGKNVESVIGDARLDPIELKKMSPEPIPDFGQKQAACLLGAMFESQEHVHVTWKNQKFVRGEVDERMHAGICMPCADILDSLDEEALDPQGGGYLYTINPVVEHPSGKHGFVRDADCLAWRYVLAECDGISLSEQAALLVRLPIPIKAIVSSGGRSLHAIIQVDAPDEKSYRDLSRGLLRTLSMLGFDPSCSNPSRKSRLPGVTRVDLATQRTNKQELLYLCANPKSEAIV